MRFAREWAAIADVRLPDAAVRAPNKTPATARYGTLAASR
jgi:hypothetical protein